MTRSTTPAAQRIGLAPSRAARKHLFDPLDLASARRSPSELGDRRRNAEDTAIALYRRITAHKEGSRETGLWASYRRASGLAEAFRLLS